MSRRKQEALFPQADQLMEAWQDFVKRREAMIPPDLLALLSAAPPATIIAIMQWTAQHLKRHARYERAYKELRALNEELLAQIDVLTSPPRPMARLFRVDRALGHAYVSLSPTTQLQVGFAEGLDPAQLEPGKDVVLNSERSCVLQAVKGPDRPTGTVRVLRFKSWLTKRPAERAAGHDVEPGPDLLLPAVAMDGDREVVVHLSRSLEVKLEAVLETGGEVKLYVDDFSQVLSIDTGQAIDPMLAAKRFQIPLERIAEDQICGLEAQKKQIRAAVACVAEFGAFVLCEGPSGSGKTWLARWVRHLLEQEGELVVLGLKATHDHRYWRQEEADIQELSDCADRLALAGKKVLVFLDEIDAQFYNSRLGQSVHSNSARATWLSVLDGGTNRPGILWFGTTNKASHLPNELLTRVSHLLSFDALVREDARGILAMQLEQTVTYTPSLAELLDVVIDMCYDEIDENVVADVTLRNQDVVQLWPKDFHVLSARFFVELGRSLLQESREHSNGVPAVIDTRSTSRITHDRLVARIRGSGLTLDNLTERCFVDFDVRNPPEKIRLVEPCAADNQTFLRYEPLELPS